MTNEELNTALYKKMFAEQGEFRSWLLEQAPEDILRNAYDYVMREDILLSLEYHAFKGDWGMAPPTSAQAYG